MKLTLPQQDIYFEQLVFPNDPIYNIGAKIEIRGIVDVEIFKKAYLELINQHDTCRSIFIKEGKDVIVQILDKYNSELEFIDFSDNLDSSLEANNYIQKEFTRSFDLFEGNLLHKFILVKVKENFHFLFCVYHHIITDGWGTSIMFRRLVQNYNEISDFGEIKSKYPFSYKDFVEDDFLYQNSESFIKDLAYWSEKFSSLPENLFEKINKKKQINESRRKELIIKRDIYNQLNDLAKSYKCSTFHLILGVLFTYLGRKYNNDDFAIGLPVLNRSKAIYKKTAGLFMGINPLRMELDFEKTFKDLIINIKNQLRQDYRHQRLPLGKLIKELKLYNQKEKLFNITLSYEKQDYASHFTNTQTSVIPLSHNSERVALAIYIREFDELEDVKIDFDYNINYFENIDSIVNHFEKLIYEVLTSPNKKLSKLDYLTEREKIQLTLDFNDTSFDYPREHTFLTLFQKQVQKFQKKVALKDDSTSYTYLELDKLSNQVAEFFIKTYGKDDKSPIGILLDRSSKMIVILLGILKAGKPYIPLDPNFPIERLNYIIKNSLAKILIIEKDYDRNIDKSGEITISTLEYVITNSYKLKGEFSQNLSSKDTAYIIYTSGSTGRPKGVEIGHKSLLNFLISIQNEPRVNSDDIFFSVTTYSFDISILEFFVPLISGATLFIGDSKLLSDPKQIIQTLEEVKPTLIQATPSFYQMLFNANWQGDKRIKVLCGGDLLSESLAKKLIDCSSELWNMYGPTETTIWSSLKKIEKPSEASNIGKPINNTQFYILDSFLNMTPIGTPGDIYIAGDGLAKGYYRNVKLTKEKFIPNPFDTKNLFYKTGDVGKWNSKGEIVFLGRNDNQVKIRGYRIELGDVESKLNQLDGIKEAVVIAKKEKEQGAFLIAYIIKEQDKQEVFELIHQLKEKLPYYMIPNSIIPLKEFPLTPNKKIDRKFLSLKNVKYHINDDDFKKPVSHLELKLLEYWKDVLNTKDLISIRDNFFALGGHSLNAVKLIELINDNFSKEITLKTIFDYPTIESLAIYLSELNVSQYMHIPSSKPKESYLLTPSQYSIWLACQRSENSIAYNMSATYTVEGNISLEKVNYSINKIIKKYEILRTNFIEVNGIPVQKIRTIEEVKFKTNISKLDKPSTISDVIYKKINTEFDLENDILIRINLIELNKGQSVLLFSTHHIIIDGLSLEIFIKEFIKYYGESIEEVDKSNLQIQFRDYSEWLNTHLEEQQLKNNTFWENYLKDYRIKETFRRNFKLENSKNNGSSFTFEISKKVTKGLKLLAQNKQVTFYTLLATLINVLIYKSSKHSDICIGVVNSGRDNKQLTGQIGMFVKTILLRTKFKPNLTFLDLLKITRNNLSEINNNSDIPLSKIGANIFDTMLVYQNPDFTLEESLSFNKLKLEPYPINTSFSRIPLVFNLFESKQQLKGIIDYNSDFFEQDTIEIIVLKFIRILNEIILNPEIEINQIDDKLEQEIDTELDFDFNF